MEYHGTAGNDTIDQRTGGIAAGTTVYGDDGDDSITLTAGQAVGGKGNDTLAASGDAWVEVLYWDAPAGVKVDLGRGTADDGYGTHDTLVGIHRVQGSAFDDTLIGGAADDAFYGAAGNNTVVGGAGRDTVSYYFAPSTAAQISYDAASDTFTVRKNFANGDHGTDVLTGVEAIAFSGDGSDGKTILRSDYVGDFRSMAPVQVALPAGAGLTQFMAGDYDGDGRTDFAYVTQVGTGTALAPTLFYTGDGRGGFANATAALIGAAPMKIVGGGRSIVADFNGDGRSDLFQLDFGNDDVPFTGGINSLYLSGAGGRMTDASATLPQQLHTNHGGSAGDVDGDGDIDVLVDTLDAGNLLLLNDGNGHFTENTSHLPHTTGANGMVETNTFSGMADVDNDGDLDLVLGTWDTSTVPGNKVLLNDGHGDFTKQPAILLPASGVDQQSVLEVEAIDLNGDAYPDLMLSVTNGGERSTFYHTDYIQLLVNDGTGHFRDETASRLPQRTGTADGGWLMSLTSVDFNHDGYADILAESAGAPITSKIYLNRGDGTFALEWESESGARAFAADVDGDGMSDVVTAGAGNTVTAWINHLGNGHLYRARPGGDTLLGSSGADRFYAGTGSDAFDGAGGQDTACFGAARAAYTVSVGAGVASVAGAQGTATLTHVERAVFADGALAFDTAGVAGQAYRIYQAALARAPDAGGLGFWIAAMDGGASLDSVAAQFVSSPEFTSTYGALDAHGFVTTIYQNVLHRAPDAAGFGFWDDALAHGLARAQLLAQFSESAENQAQVIGAIANGMAYLPFH